MKDEHGNKVTDEDLIIDICMRYFQTRVKEDGEVTAEKLQ